MGGRWEATEPDPGSRLRGNDRQSRAKGRKVGQAQSRRYWSVSNKARRPGSAGALSGRPGRCGRTRRAEGNETKRNRRGPPVRHRALGTRPLWDVSCAPRRGATRNLKRRGELVCTDVEHRARAGRFTARSLALVFLLVVARARLSGDVAFSEGGRLQVPIYRDTARAPRRPERMLGCRIAVAIDELSSTRHATTCRLTRAVLVFCSVLLSRSHRHLSLPEKTRTETGIHTGMSKRDGLAPSGMTWRSARGHGEGSADVQVQPLRR